MATEKLQSRQTEIHIESTQRPYYADVQSVCDADGYLRFSVDAGRIDRLVFQLSEVLSNYRPDEVIAGVGIMFMLVMWRFQFQLGSYLRFVDNFLKADDEKLGIFAAQRLLHTHFTNHVTRYEKIKFKNTRTVKF